MSLQVTLTSIYSQTGPEILYNEELKHTNPLHCIHRNPAWQEKYYSSMSEAYARMARETATVMHTAKDFSDPPLTGIWGKIELPVLRLKTNIKEVSFGRRFIHTCRLRQVKLCSNCQRLDDKVERGQKKI